jgi:hypothetical protein
MSETGAQQRGGEQRGRVLGGDEAAHVAVGEVLEHVGGGGAQRGEGAKPEAAGVDDALVEGHPGDRGTALLAHPAGDEGGLARAALGSHHDDAPAAVDLREQPLAPQLAG